MKFTAAFVRANQDPAVPIVGTFPSGAVVTILRGEAEALAEELQMLPPEERPSPEVPYNFSISREGEVTDEGTAMSAKSLLKALKGAYGLPVSFATWEVMD